MDELIEKLKEINSWVDFYARKDEILSRLTRGSNFWEMLSDITGSADFFAQKNEIIKVLEELKEFEGCD